MSDLLDEQHAQVGLVLLRNYPGLGEERVFDGVVPKQVPPLPPLPMPYVLVYTTVSWPRDGVGTALSGTQVTVTTTWNCHCVGETAESARGVAMFVRSALLNVRPVIVGRNCGLIKQMDEPNPPQRDETTGSSVMDAQATYGFISTPG